MTILTYMYANLTVEEKREIDIEVEQHQAQFLRGVRAGLTFSVTSLIFQNLLVTRVDAVDARKQIRECYPQVDFSDVPKSTPSPNPFQSKGGVTLPQAAAGGVGTAVVCTGLGMAFDFWAGFCCVVMAIGTGISLDAVPPTVPVPPVGR